MLRPVADTFADVTARNDPEEVTARLSRSLPPGDPPELLAYLGALGASEEEIAAAGSVVGGLGPLALDLVLRPAGEQLRLDEFAAVAGLDPELLARVWLACGLPRTPEHPFPVTPDLAEALRLLVGFAELVGVEAVLGFARVAGSSVARMAESLSALTRVAVEVPQRAAGTPYAEVVKGYTEAARDGLPAVLETIAALFRRHLILVSYQTWSTDEEQSAVTLERTVGFADLVGSTEALRRLSVRELAGMVDRFEQVTWDVVTSGGGRLVKLIGDEAMFVHPDPARACEIARDVVRLSPAPIRAGLAHGPVVALHGDYYGPTVNLAARLVTAAAPGAILVSESISDHVRHARFRPVQVEPLRGFSEDLVVLELE